MEHYKVYHCSHYRDTRKRKFRERDKNVFEKIMAQFFFFNLGKKRHIQNITRDVEVKNNLTIARGEWGGDSGERGLQELL